MTVIQSTGLEYEESGLTAAPEKPGEIRAAARNRCLVCGAGGLPLYSRLHDRLFAAPGLWNLVRCENADCGLLWLNPMPIEEDIAKAYVTYYTHDAEVPSAALTSKLRERIKRAYLSLRWGYPDRSPWLVRVVLGGLAFLSPPHRANFDFEAFYLPANPSGRLLEIGCGSGETLARMQALGWQVTGVDVDPTAVETARRRGLDVRLGAVETQRFADASFDAIALSHVIEHVHDPVGLIRECRRLLKRGGRLVMITPNSRSFGHARFRADWMALDPPRHLHLFGPKNIKAVAVQAGFQEVGVSTTIRDANNAFIGSEHIRAESCHRWGDKGGLLRKIWGRVLQLVEWARLKANPNSGEELLVTARKRGD